MLKTILAVLLVSTVSLDARASLWGRDKVSSLWTDKPVALGAGDEPWLPADETDETSVILRAKNDASDLYLLVAPDGRAGKGLLSGGYRQDAALWFLGPDRKTRVWGVRVPFSRLDQTTSVEPEYLAVQGTQVSTAPFPADVSVRLERDSRRPLLEVKIALKELSLADGKPVPFDLTTTAVPQAVAEQILSEKPKPRAPGSGGGGHHGGGRHGGGRMGGGGSSPSGENEGGPSGSPGGQGGGKSTAAGEAPTVPDPLSLELSVKIAPAPH